MAEEKKGLSGMFNSFAKHLFSPTMIFMMVAMALPAVSAAAAAAGTTATFGDIAMGTLDMGWQMISAPFTDGGTVIDAFQNAGSGNFAAGSYEFGNMHHGASAAVPHTAGAATHVSAQYAADAAFFGVDAKEHASLLYGHK
jgi:hypothetical protein